VKPGIHPKYVEVEVRCACGNKFMTKSTKPELHLEICGPFHQFFTGRQKPIDNEGPVGRLPQRPGRRAPRKKVTKDNKAHKAGRTRKKAAPQGRHPGRP